MVVHNFNKIEHWRIKASSVADLEKERERGLRIPKIWLDFHMVSTRDR